MKKLPSIFSQLVLLLLLVFTASGVVSAKVASGVQDLASGSPQAETSLEAAWRLGSGVSSYDDASGSPLVPKGTKKLSGKNPPINKHRQKLHTDGTPGKSQFKDGVDADKVVEDAWHNGTPRFNSNGKLIGKVKQYKDQVGTQGQTSVDVRFSRKHGIHGFPSNKTE